VRLDLHIHTMASDGAWSPEAVVRAAARGRLDVIAVTDHDTVAAVGVAREAASGLDVDVLTGIEVSSTHGGRDVHVLGYGVDPEATALVGYCTRASAGREGRMREILSRLSGQGIDIDLAEVEQAAGPDRVNLGRPHLARALVARGFASSIPKAFDTLIGDGLPAFVPTGLLSPTDAVDLVRDAGGLAVWAHPPGSLVDVLLPTLIEHGLRGLEVYRPGHTSGDVSRLEGICRGAQLVATGGSDWHTPDSGSALGDFAVSSDQIGPFLEELGGRRR
jgi:predicted metal-dependent phosphoesterase TrpH